MTDYLISISMQLEHWLLISGKFKKVVQLFLTFHSKSHKKPVIIMDLAVIYGSFENKNIKFSRLAWLETHGFQHRVVTL